MNWYLTCLKEHYADFKGRARRKEYWMFVLFNVIVSMVLTILGGLIKCSWIGSLYSFGRIGSELGRIGTPSARHGSQRLVDSHLVDSRRRCHLVDRAPVPRQPARSQRVG